jgi:hypothetical protein
VTRNTFEATDGEAQRESEREREKEVIKKEVQLLHHH